MQTTPRAPGAGLPEQLQGKDIIVAPGVYDAFTAFVAERAGFSCLYLSGAAVAYTRLGRPDIGLVTATEMAETLSLITARVACPIIVDGDTGYGNALNTQRTVRLFERAGAAAIQIEDQTFPKRCGHLRNKSVIAAGEMVGKIKAAVDARASERMLVIARTDAAAVEGLEPALERAALYAQAGADILFIEAPPSRDDLATICTRFGGQRPLLANMVEGGRTPSLTATELAAIGFKLVIFPGGIVRAFGRLTQDYYGNLRQQGSNAALKDSMLDFDELNDLLGTEALLADAVQYEG
ncbi:MULTISPECIES: isocitrate lyase/phosphoenolpyruvate mutase family protein [unclassified Beijerinckia]|uniref:isocitrate lyase/PEP mutase family protein n=1 Tax=unclassified Beijerinckia TaxID=2638183 RepID=UPI0008979F8C|nr:MULTISPECIES: isocitrate lyase/phosphoenolpyruvate mutase family protein [unclassified Beijerinckia]SEC92323.1 2-Methylisocitrate lyase, PEP mutase family [Beijerinckia sp. 28-YEA-48]